MQRGAHVTFRGYSQYSVQLQPTGARAPRPVTGPSSLTSHDRLARHSHTSRGTTRARAVIERANDNLSRARDCQRPTASPRHMCAGTITVLPRSFPAQECTCRDNPHALASTARRAPRRRARIVE